MNNTTPDSTQTHTNPSNNRNAEFNFKSQVNTQKQHKIFQRHFNKAVQFQSQNNISLAIELYDKALQYNNNHLPTLQVLATLLYQEKLFGKALHFYARAVELHAHSAQLHNALGKCYEHCQQWQKARTHYLNAIELRQDDAEALNNFGNICRKLGDYQQAEYSLLRALRLCISVPTLINLGVFMAEMRNYAQAYSFFDHALRMQPFNNQIKWHKALLLLTEGEFKQGWELYTCHSTNKTDDNYLHAQPTTINPSDDKPLSFLNKTILISGKQNINDEVMFASCFPEVIQQAKKCYIECDARLVNLFKRSFPGAEIKAKSDKRMTQWVDKSESIDMTLSMLNIVRTLRQSFSDFPFQHSYLSSSATASRRWLERYTNQEDGLLYGPIHNFQQNNQQRTHSKNKMKIGIAWLTSDDRESINAHCPLNQWESIFAHSKSQLVNLQCGQVQDELALFMCPVLDWRESDQQYNIDQLAAQISALDLVITASNLVAHLAGALGKTVWIILPYAADWRWFNGKQPCPWYNSARIFRQKAPGDWTNLFKTVNQRLLALQRQNQHQNQATNSQKKLAV